MLGSNQRPLPCEGRSITPWLFAGVQKYLRNDVSLESVCCDCSPSFARVGVLLVYKRCEFGTRHGHRAGEPQSFLSRQPMPSVQMRSNASVSPARVSVAATGQPRTKPKKGPKSRVAGNPVTNRP